MGKDEKNDISSVGDWFSAESRSLDAVVFSDSSYAELISNGNDQINPIKCPNEVEHVNAHLSMKSKWKIYN